MATASYNMMATHISFHFDKPQAVLAHKARLHETDPVPWPCVFACRGPYMGKHVNSTYYLHAHYHSAAHTLCGSTRTMHMDTQEGQPQSSGGDTFQSPPQQCVGPPHKADDCSFFVFTHPKTELLFISFSPSMTCPPPNATPGTPPGLHTSAYVAHTYTHACPHHTHAHTDTHTHTYTSIHTQSHCLHIHQHNALYHWCSCYMNMWTSPHVGTDCARARERHQRRAPCARLSHLVGLRSPASFGKRLHVLRYAM